MNIGVIGGRGFTATAIYTNQDYVDATLDRVCNWYGLSPSECKLISGGSQGTETLAVDWAKKRRAPYEILPPNIRKYADYPNKNDLAFGERNIKIINEAQMVVFFWPGYAPLIMDAVQVCIRDKKLLFCAPMV